MTSTDESGEYICFNLKDLNNELEKLALAISESQGTIGSSHSIDRGEASNDTISADDRRSRKDEVSAQDCQYPRSTRSVSRQGTRQRPPIGDARKGERDSHPRRDEIPHREREDPCDDHYQGPRPASRKCKRCSAETTGARVNANQGDLPRMESCPEEPPSYPEKPNKTKPPRSKDAQSEGKNRSRQLSNKPELSDDDSCTEGKKNRSHYPKSRGNSDYESDRESIRSKRSAQSPPGRNKCKLPRDSSRRHPEQQRVGSDSELSRSSEEDLPRKGKPLKPLRESVSEDSLDNADSFNREQSRRHKNKCIQEDAKKRKISSSDDDSDRGRKTKPRKQVKPKTRRDKADKPRHEKSRVDGQRRQSSKDSKERKPKRTDLESECIICDCTLDKQAGKDDRCVQVCCDCGANKHREARRHVHAPQSTNTQPSHRPPQGKVRGENEVRNSGKPKDNSSKDSKSRRRDSSSRPRGQRSNTVPPSKRTKYQEASVCLKPTKLTPAKHAMREGVVSFVASNSDLATYNQPRRKQHRTTPDSTKGGKKRHKKGTKTYFVGLQSPPQRESSSQSLLCEECQHETKQQSTGTSVGPIGCLNQKEMELALSILDKHIHQYASGTKQTIDPFFNESGGHNPTTSTSRADRGHSRTMTSKETNRRPAHSNGKCVEVQIKLSQQSLPAQNRYPPG